MWNRVASLSHMRNATLVLTLGLLAVLAGWALTRGVTVAAQAQNAPGKADPKALVTDLDDIDRLRVLNPLKLTSDQLDKLIASLTAAQADYDKKVTAIGAEVISPNADEIHATKKQVLGGAEVPKTFDDKIKKMQADFLKRRDSLNAENIQRISSEAHAILTEKQIAAATKMERDEYNKNAKENKGTDAQFFNLYVVDTFISYPHILPLLKEMRAAPQ